MTRTIARREDMEVASSLLGRKLSGLPPQYQDTFWRLSSSNVLMVEKGYIVRWKPPRGPSNRNPRRGVRR